MKLYEDYSNSLIDKSTFIATLSLVQSFTFRRFILGLPTNALNKIFMTLYDKVELNNYLFSIQKSLIQRTGIQRFPRNSEITNALKEKDVYNIKPKNRTYLLERIENFKNNEPVIIEGNSDITIEHIFPQNPDPKWKIDLGTDEYNFIKENCIHTIGNLTLSGNNGKLGNKPFLYKQMMNIEGKEQGYKFSRLWLNRNLKEKTKWDKEEIENRTIQIAERFLSIWDIPDIEMVEQLNNDEVNIFDADDPTGKRIDYAYFFEQKLEPRHMADFYIIIIEKLFELQPESFIDTDLGRKLKISKDVNIYGNLQYAKMSNNYFILTNTSSSDKFERIKQALEIFGFEDELMIKYAD